MFKCIHCGHEFDEPQKDYDRGTGRMDECCPNCGSEDIVEVKECALCGELHAEEYLIEGVCEKCLEKKVAMETAMTYGMYRKSCVELNGLLAYAFTASEIEEILTAVLKSVGPWADHYVKDFCMDDKYDFAEWLKGEDDDTD